MQTAALAAYIQGRQRFVGAIITFESIVKVCALPHDGGETINDVTLQGVARFYRMTVEDLTAAVEATVMPVAEPVTAPAPAPEPDPVADTSSIAHSNDDGVEITFDDREATPVPDDAASTEKPATETSTGATMPSTPSAKSKSKSKSKKPSR
jgi:hypothetical protein